MSHENEPNPYAAPGSAKPVPAVDASRPGLGVLLIGFLGLQIAGNLYLAGRMVFDRAAMEAADPHGPAWSFPARAVFAMCLVAACVGLLMKRRAAFYAYLAISFASLPLNAARGVTSVPALIGAAVVAPVIVWLLLRNRMSSLR